MYISKSQYRIQAATRAGNDTGLCLAQTAPFADPIGDRIIINPGASKLNQRIPQTEAEAQQQKWSYVNLLILYAASGKRRAPKLVPRVF